MITLPNLPAEDIHWLGPFPERPERLRLAGRDGRVVELEPFVAQVTTYDNRTRRFWVLARRDITQEQTAIAKREAERAIEVAALGP